MILSEKKLLSSKLFIEFTPEEYHEYIKGLFKERVRKETKKKKGARKILKVTAKKKKDGSLSLRTRRNPPYLTEGEFDLLSREHGIKKNELFLLLKEKRFILTKEHLILPSDLIPGGV
jgi:hypothetical protein